jgi:hypothetical protein
MVIANTRDGSTSAFDLTIEAQYKSLQKLLSIKQVTALSLHNNGSQVTLPLPKRFRELRLGADLVTSKAACIGERIYAQTETVRVSLLLTFKSKLIRCDLIRTGRMLYNPK